jgi:hypothetical protein
LVGLVRLVGLVGVVHMVHTVRMLHMLRALHMLHTSRIHPFTLISHMRTIPLAYVVRGYTMCAWVTERGTGWQARETQERTRHGTCRNVAR